MSTSNIQEQTLEYKPTNNYINKIEITKVRHLQDITINVTQGELKHLILTGKNGSGKTSVLEKVRDYLASIQSGDYIRLITSAKDKEKFEPIVKLLENKETLSQSEAQELNSSRINLRWANSSLQKYSDGIKVILNQSDNLKDMVVNTIIDKYQRGDFIIVYFPTIRIVDIKRSTA